jgi:hypothetical protein
MARPGKATEIDYTNAHDLTHRLLKRATCPDGLPFVQVKDADKKGLRLPEPACQRSIMWCCDVSRNRFGMLISRALQIFPRNA